MALPIINSQITVTAATKNVIKYIETQEGVSNIFKIEALRQFINSASISPIRKHYLIKTIDIYI